MRKQWLVLGSLISLTFAQSALAVPDLSAQEFLQWSKRHLLLQPIQVVTFLNDIFSRFDACLQKYVGLNKIKTIG